MPDPVGFEPTTRRGEGDGVTPLVSVIVPTYYRNDTLPTAVWSALTQRHEPVEVIVVDDSGEQHARPAVPPDDRVQYVPLDRNRGAHRAREIGLSHADGEYVQFLDDDDRLRERKLDHAIAVFADRDVGVVYCGVETTDGLVERPSPDARGDVLDRALAFELWPCMTSTMLIERAALAAVRPLNDRPAGQDLELMIRLAQRTQFDFVDAPQVVKRNDGDTLGRSPAAAESRFALIEEYAPLYEDRPAVRRRALANAHRTKGALLLHQRLWSPTALRSFLACLRLRPEPTAAAKLLAALFGRPGWQLARAVGRRL